MIEAPHRSVTRFFVPLLDVLLLLFCIFLLMPMSTEESLGRDEASQRSAEDMSLQIEALSRDIEGRITEMEKYEGLRPELLDLVKLQKELEELRAEKINALKKRLVIRVLEVDGENGELSYFDPGHKPPVTKITGPESAKSLIERLTKEAGEREQYFQFFWPRYSVFPTGEDRDNYQKWFDSVAHSLEKKKKGK